LHSRAEDEALFNMFNVESSHSHHVSKFDWSIEYFMLAVCPYWGIATMGCWERLMLENGILALEVDCDNGSTSKISCQMTSTEAPHVVAPSLSLPILREALQVITHCRDLGKRRHRNIC
jgi:hypothetical protein